MPRKRHPNAHIEEALKYAEEHGWRVEKSRSHAKAWGKMFCPHNDPECRCGEFCVSSIWTTPRVPENHARQIRRVVDGCIGDQDEQED